MLRLDAEPRWLTLVPAEGEAPAAEVLMRPVTRAAVIEARAAVVGIEGAGAGSLIRANDAMSAALIKAGMLDWRGIGDAEGLPLPCTPENVEMLLQHPEAFEALERLYVRPWIERDAEKNGSSGSPNGTSAGAMPGNDTATPSAKRMNKGGAARKKG